MLAYGAARDPLWNYPATDTVQDKMADIAHGFAKISHPGYSRSLGVGCRVSGVGYSVLGTENLKPKT